MRVLVLGAGFGGLELTTRLSDEFGEEIEVVLIDQADGFVFGFSKLDVMFGRTVAAAVRHPYRDLVKPACASCRPPSGQSTRRHAVSRPTPAVSRGLDGRRPRRRPRSRRPPPGSSKAGHEFYTVEGAFAAREVLSNFEGGRVIVGVTSTPFKCPPAPSETALLIARLSGRSRAAGPFGDLARDALAGADPPVASSFVGTARGVRSSAISVGTPTSLYANSTRVPTSPGSPTAPKCPTSCSSESRPIACRRSSPSPA